MALPQNPLLARLGIEHPLLLAPLGGGPSTPELVAAVSNAGGLGWLGAAYLSPDQIRDAIRQIRALTSRPFGVNLFAGGYQNRTHPDPAPMLAILAEVHATLGLPAPSLPQLPPDPFPAQFEAVMADPPAAFSFTFGIPDAESMRRLRDRDVAATGTATTVAEARLLADAGVDAIFAQGGEAGGHRGTFAGLFESSMVPTSTLVPAVCGSVSVPVIASGGIMNGAEIAHALRLGASAAALGTAFLACPESGASSAYKEQILAATADTTVITRAFSGRSARGLPNEFIAKLANREDWILPYPLQNILTRAMRSAAASRGDARFLSLWAGSGVALARKLPAADLVRQLLTEMDAS